MSAKRERTSTVDHMPFSPKPGQGPMGMMLSAPPVVKNRKDILRRLWGYLGVYRLSLILIVVLVVLSSGLFLMCPYLIGQSIDNYIVKNNLPGLAKMILLLSAIYIITAGIAWIQSIIMIRVAQNTVSDIRRDLFAKLQTLPLRYFDKHPHGELMSRLTNDTDTICSTLGESVTQLIGSLLSIIGAGSIMFSMNWRLTIACLITFPMVMIVTKYIGKYTLHGFRLRQQKLGKLNGLVEETILGQRIVKVCGRESEAKTQLSAANSDLKNAAIKATIYVGLMGPVMTLFRNLGFAILAGTGGWLVIKGMISVGTVAAFMNYADFFNRPLTQLANLYGSIQSALAGAERVFKVMDEEPETEDSADAINLNDIKGEVIFNNVSFSYVPETNVLNDISFQAKPGQTIAIVGSTGAGKTTIINLLMRFYDIDEGAILIDGNDIRELKKDSLRRSLGIVLQDTVLFAGSVKDNIRYGRPEATDAEIIAVAEFANADFFIRHLPNGYDTILSDAGSSLSQGQRQLLTIARTMLADPAILILDEATSSVDTRTEIHLQQAFNRLMHGRTSFIIAHRLSTIRLADNILVIEHGKIVEQGNHTDLLRINGVYNNLYESQFKNSIN